MPRLEANSLINLVIVLGLIGIAAFALGLGLKEIVSAITGGLLGYLAREGQRKPEPPQEPKG